MRPRLIAISCKGASGFPRAGGVRDYALRLEVIFLPEVVHDAGIVIQLVNLDNFCERHEAEKREERQVQPKYATCLLCRAIAYWVRPLKADGLAAFRLRGMWTFCGVVANQER